MDIFGIFLDKVKKTPDEIMIIDEEKSYSYAEVSAMVDYYSGEINKKTSGKKKRVLLRLSHSYRIIVSILAVLKSGNSYVPISKEASDDRIMNIAKYCNSNILITDNEGSDEMEEIFFGDEKKIPSCNNEYYKYNDADEVYVLFTSGSTGEPKGCSITYHNLCYIMKNMLIIGDWNANSKVCFSTPYTFDVSTTEIYGFVYGASIFVCDTAQSEKFKKFPYIISDNRITHLALSPSGLKNMYNAYTEEQLDLMGESLTCVMVAGEAFKKEIYARWNNSKWNYHLWNLYGPTEATVYATGYELHKGDVYNQSIPIGKCLEGCVFYIDNPDENGIGELILGGDGIANGYINNSAESKKRFLNIDNVRYYRTGDLVALENEILMYHGRNDDQVQINGIRVELGEIEARINEIEAIRESVVIHHNGMLIASIVLNKGMEVSSSEIRKKLAGRMPRYMIPNVIRFVDSFKQNASNKIDRKKVLKDYLAEKEKKTEKTLSNSDEKVLSLMRECLEEKGDSLSLDDDFFECGGDSLSALLLITKLEQVYNLILDVDVIYACRSCRKIIGYINEIDNEKNLLDTGKQISYDNIVDLTRQIKSYLYCDNDMVQNSYKAMYLQKYYYDRRFNSTISFKYDVGTQFTLKEVNSAIMTLVSENSILSSRIRIDNDWVYFDEYMVADKKIPIIELPFDDSEFVDFVINNYSEEIFTSRYSNGLLALFVIVKVSERLSIVGMLDHTIADGASVSIIKIKIGNILNGNKVQDAISYRDYCHYIRKEQCNIGLLLDSWYMKKLREGEVKNKEQLLNSKETESCHYIIENITDESNTSIIKHVGYWLGENLSEWISNDCIALRFIVNLRDYCNVSLKSTLGDLHASLSFYYCKGDTDKNFSERVDSTIELLGDFCSRHSLYIEDNKFSDESRVEELTDLIDNAEFISVSYQGIITDEELKKYEREISEAHKRLSSANARLFVTVFVCEGDAHIFLNKKVINTP